ncbi:NAD(P)-dependent iron-only hydrogenase catalytic subunit [Desulfotomaculum arcticum]|uniref:NAD(P)-dependent iron-only hydrogenase catalytic subunit n=1 Tax=Desulfotruncus arcticus DSM 17038 TaxID=1121424 RepID=A0A1I2U5A7_9FIRM|nr:NADH-dependent [FeFe] hydrogenase, group A6 [Desulfotruncus arcticus]SFG69801.1 NAD(P)-dependent iron-only hydrogenase catalytic subunit [Desulfotomaculum arcticum] [Desulfotruncus arcticus DSM 17038]
MSQVSLTIDGIEVQAVPGTSVLEAAKKAGIKIPTLCYLEEINEIGACRICLVEVQGARTLQASCVTPVAPGMVVRTNTPAVRQARKLNLELIMSNHPQECLTCPRSTNCELQQLASELGITEIRFSGANPSYEPDFSSAALVRDPRKCILCRRCVSVCEKVQQVCAIAPQERGFNTIVAPAFLEPLGDTACVNCGQCALVCPTAAIHEKDQTAEVWAALSDPGKHVVVQTAPAVRVSIGEMFGLEPGSVVTGQLVAALRKLGFDKVFDTDFTADLTIMEEGSELLQRMQNGGQLPLITSCSPGWIKFIEHFYPGLLPHLSTCKSPQQMFGALAKTYYAEKSGIDPADIFVVSIMPCTAKKFEAGRQEMNGSGCQDVDVALTTRELGKMLKEAGIDFNSLAEEDYDHPLGISTGAGVIFGSTGGVMEAALRTAYELVTGQALPALDFEEVRGLEGIKEASVDLNGTVLNVAVAHGLANAREMMERVQNGKQYHFIEIMCCPGGCIGGGGQPIPTTREIRAQRAAGIYSADKSMELRKSHENPAVQALYKEFLGEPLGHQSHELLHTHYTARKKY